MMIMILTTKMICPIFLVPDDKTLLCLHCPTSSIMRARASMSTISLLYRLYTYEALEHCIW